MTKINPKKDKHSKPRLLFTGISMGLADLVPGVSGGTIAFLYGIYEELLFSIKQLTGQFPRLLFKGRFKESFKAIPFGFLVPLFIGIAGSIFAFSNLVTYLLNNQALFVWSLFFGLVLGSSYVISKRLTHWNLKRLGLLVGGFVFAYIIIGLSANNSVATPLAIFFTGMIAFCAMILPGISGSLIMVILGQYENVINAVSQRDFGLLIFLLAGGAIGLSLFARLLSWLLNNYHGATIAFLMGLMVGSLRAVWPWKVTVSGGQELNTVPVLDWTFLVVILFVLLGFGLVWLLERFGVTEEHDDINAKEFEQEISHRKND